MPRRRKPYVLTETAAGDFRVARTWSSSRWGKERTRSYFTQIHAAAEHIAANQLAVSRREDLAGSTGLGVYPVGEHYLVYVPIDNEQIAIVALIRQTRDVPAILRANHYRIEKALATALKR